MSYEQLSLGASAAIVIMVSIGMLLLSDTRADIREMKALLQETIIEMRVTNKDHERRLTKVEQK